MTTTRRSIPTRTPLKLGLLPLLLLTLTPTAAADACDASSGVVPIFCHAENASDGFEAWWNGLSPGARDFLTNPLGFVTSKIIEAIQTVFDLLSAAVDAVVNMLLWPFTTLYNAIGGLFTSIGTLLHDAALGTIGAIGHAFSRVTLGLLSAAPFLGPLAPLLTTLLFTGTAVALVYTGATAISVAKAAFTRGVSD